MTNDCLKTVICKGCGEIGHLRISCLNIGQIGQMDTPNLADMRTIFDNDSDTKEHTSLNCGEMLEILDGQQQEILSRGEKRNLCEYKETNSNEEENTTRKMARSENLEKENETNIDGSELHNLDQQPASSSSHSTINPNIGFGEMLESLDGHQQELPTRGEKRKLGEYEEPFLNEGENTSKNGNIENIGDKNETNINGSELHAEEIQPMRSSFLDNECSESSCKASQLIPTSSSSNLPEVNNTKTTTENNPDQKSYQFLFVHIETFNSNKSSSTHLTQIGCSAGSSEFLCAIKPSGLARYLDRFKLGGDLLKALHMTREEDGTFQFRSQFEIVSDQREELICVSDF